MGDGDTFPVLLPPAGESRRELVPGVGTFLAYQVGPIVQIVAWGTRPLNVDVALAATLIDIFHPEHALIFLQPEIVLPVESTFSVSAAFVSKERLDSVVVWDKAGKHRVNVQQTPF